MANSEDSSAEVELNPTEKFSSLQSIQGKPLSTKESVIDSSVSLEKRNSQVRISSTARDDPNASGTAATSLLMSDPELPSDLSASASALEKSAQESKKFPEPRPTRTSSLRARISTGNLTTNAKVVGFTDFTTIKEGSGITEQGTLRIASDSSTRSKISSLSAVPGKKPPTSPARVNRAPTKFIASNRRPAVLHRPSSRGNLRGDAHDRNTADGNCPPSRNAPDIPTSKICDAEIAKESKEQLESAAPERHRSSIPLFQGAVRSIAEHGGDESDIVKCGPKPAADSKHHPRKGLSVFEDRKLSTSSAKVALLMSNASSTQKQGRETLLRVKKSEESPILECVDESPRASYQIKRLSMTSPEYGPTLRISSSAERLIMGKDTDKEIQEDLKQKQSKDLRRTVITKELRKTATDIELNSRSRMHHERPHMSGSLPQSRSRIYIMDDDVEQKEGESAATRHALPTNNLDLEFPGRKTTEPLRNEDPFFDARSQISHNGSAIVETYPTTIASVGVGARVETPMDVQNIIPMEEASWMSPIAKKISSTRLSDAMPVNPAYLPTSMLEHVRKSAQTESLDDLTHMAPKELLSAPEHYNQDRPSTSPGDFPPRSSSRVQARDYTVNALTNSNSPALPTDTGKCLSNDFRARQNRLGKASGCGSKQLDFTDLNAMHDSVTRGSIARESITRESSKSQESYPKGVISNIRGLFHKRSVDAPGLKPSVKATKNGKGRISINSNGSPFPPMSEVHPIHRPTFASKSKSRAAMAIDKKSPFRSHESPNCNDTTSDATPAFQSPVPTEISTISALAVQVLDSARLETSSPTRERLLEIGKALVDTVTQAREAEKAMTEAKLAATRAEMSHLRCQESVKDVAKCVREWGRNSGRGRL